MLKVKKKRFMSILSWAASQLNVRNIQWIYISPNKRYRWDMFEVDWAEDQLTLWKTVAFHF